MLLLCGPLTEQPAADFTNVRVPFYKSIRVTAQLPQGHAPFSVYTIIRGQENVPLSIGGLDISAEKPRLRCANRFHNHSESESECTRHLTR